MSDYTDGPSDCDAIQDELTELALGILTGRERSEVLLHVEGCPRCSAELEKLSIVADTLLQLAPEVEPPVGFELRLAARLGALTTLAPRRRFRRASILAGAAVIAVGFGFGLGAATTGRGNSDQARSATADLTSTTLGSHGHDVGEVMVSAGRPAWMFMAVDGGSRSGSVRCTLTLNGGKVETIGVFKLWNGHGAWGAPLTASADQVRSVRLIAPDGDVVASARLSA